MNLTSLFDGEREGTDKEEKARRFRRMVAEGRKKDALEYFSGLSAEEKRYIQNNREYQWVLKSARMQF